MYFFLLKNEKALLDFIQIGSSALALILKGCSTFCQSPDVTVVPRLKPKTSLQSLVSPNHFDPIHDLHLQISDHSLVKTVTER